MDGKFRLGEEVETQDVGFATLRMMCHPAATGARQLLMVDATFDSGQGHNFHQHPNQEEIIYVLSGRIEQWIDKERRVLGPGDAAFLPAGTVHASFNVGDGEARLLAVFGPCIGAGFETIDLAEEAPWNALRPESVAA